MQWRTEQLELHKARVLASKRAFSKHLLHLELHGDVPHEVLLKVGKRGFRVQGSGHEPLLLGACLSPCRETARERLADERRRRDPHSSRSVSWLGSAQLSSFVEL